MTELSTVRAEITQRSEVLHETAPLSIELKQFLATIGTLLHADHAALISQGNCDTPYVSMEWRPLPGTVARPNAIILEPPSSAPCPAPESLNAGHELLAHLTDAGEGGWRLSVERERESTPFTALEAKAAALLFDLFRNAFVLWRSLQVRARHLAAMETLAHAASHAIFLVDENTVIVFANRRAEALLAENSGLVRSHARLTASAFEDAVRLQAALHYVLRNQASGEETATPLITIRRTGAPHFYAAVVPVTPDEGGASTLAAVYVVDPAVDLSEAVGHTCQLHGLTQAETRLTKHLVAGLSLQAAAASMKIQLHTARAYLKQVFSKLGVSRQAELVRLLMASLVPMRARFTSIAP